MIPCVVTLFSLPISIDVHAQDSGWFFAYLIRDAVIYWTLAILQGLGWNFTGIAHTLGTVPLGSGAVVIPTLQTRKPMLEEVVELSLLINTIIKRPKTALHFITWSS